MSELKSTVKNRYFIWIVVIYTFLALIGFVLAPVLGPVFDGSIGYVIRAVVIIIPIVAFIGEDERRL